MPSRRRRRQKRSRWDWFEKKSKKFLILLGLIPVTLLGAVATVGKHVWNNYFAEPKWICTQTETGYTFATEGDFRGENLRPERQILVEHEEHIVAIIPLENYYEEGYLSFGGRTEIEVGANRAHESELVRYVKNGILEDLGREGGGEFTRKAETGLLVYPSMLGGVEYQNKWGNNTKNRAIIEQDYIVLNYKENDKVVKQRSRVSTVILDAGLSPADQQEALDQVIREAVKEIQKLEETRIQRIFLRCLKILGIALLVLAALAAIGMLLFWHRPVPLPLLKGLFAGRRRYRNLLAGGIAVFVLFSTAQAKNLKRDEKLTYVEAESAVQRDPQSLFAPNQPEDTPQQAEEVEESWPPEAVLERLHIPKDLVGVPLNQAMLDHYETQFEPIYQNGVAQPPAGAILPEWMDLNSFPYDAMDSAVAEPIYVEGAKCRNSRPACLYQLGRALTDAVLTHPELGFEVLFHTAADAVAVGEQFLTYEDRDIADDEPLILHAGNIALLNGKLYWTLANYLEVRGLPEEYEGYLDCLYAAGVQCVKCGRDQTSLEDPIYATLTYYLGNFSEKMLGRISKGTQGEFYDRIGRDALAYYEEAEALLRQGTGYLSENHMDRNIQDGINTLNGLGFETQKAA